MMDPRSILRVSVESLGVHKLRTMLTMLGVIFGVAAVVSMLSIGEGAKREALQQISILGVNNIIVRARTGDPASDDAETWRRSPGLSRADGENIARFSDLIERVVPQRFEAAGTVRHGSSEAPARIVATLPSYLYSSSIDVESGRFLAERDLVDHGQVCVLGAKTKRELFAFEAPIGRTVRIGDLDFTVVGVMADKYIGRGKVEGFELKNLNEDVYIPFTTAMKKLSRKQTQGGGGRQTRGGFERTTEEGPVFAVPELDQLTVTVREVRFIPAVTRLIDRILERRHHGIPDYEIVVPESLIRQTQKTQRVFNIVMGAIAGLSMLVGGIGIMNIMLVSVTERTREIGLRQALGARPRDVLLQFLIEAITLSLVGGLAGVLLGVGGAELFGRLGDMQTRIVPASVPLAFGAAAAVGIFFGYYPAIKAAQLDPIVALRHE